MRSTTRLNTWRTRGIRRANAPHWTWPGSGAGDHVSRQLCELQHLCCPEVEEFWESKANHQQDTPCYRAIEREQFMNTLVKEISGYSSLVWAVLQHFRGQTGSAAPEFAVAADYQQMPQEPVATFAKHITHMFSGLRSGKGGPSHCSWRDL
jgi:hypothetical protein